jgi:hypothetical protein
MSASGTTRTSRIAEFEPRSTVYSALTSAALIIGHHLSISAFWSAASVLRRLLLAWWNLQHKIGEPFLSKRLMERSEFVSQALEHHIDTGRKHAVVACFKLRDLRA